MLTRSDVLRANRKRLHETRHVERIISWKPAGDAA